MRQPEVARPRAVTRSGRVSHPPSRFGLRGDVEDKTIMKSKLYLLFRIIKQDLFRIIAPSIIGVKEDAFCYPSRSSSSFFAALSLSFASRSHRRLPDWME